MPPFLFGPIVEKLGKHGLVKNARIVVEKPFGHDLESARELNARLRSDWPRSRFWAPRVRRSGPGGA